MPMAPKCTELTGCIVSVQEWMNCVKLKLSPDKTESSESSIPKFPIKFLQNSTKPAETVKTWLLLFTQKTALTVMPYLLLSP